MKKIIILSFLLLITGCACHKKARKHIVINEIIYSNK